MIVSHSYKDAFMSPPIRFCSDPHHEKLSRNSGVYEIVNTVTGHRYVGSSNNIRRRWSSHAHTASGGGKGGSTKLAEAWQQYGREAFDFRVLEVCAEDDLIAKEQEYLDALQPEYNIAPQSVTNKGMTFPEDTNARKGRPRVTYDLEGRQVSLRVLVRHYGVVTEQCARERLSRGWEPIRAVTTPPTSYSDRGKLGQEVLRKKPARGTVYTVQGVSGTLRELAEHFGVCSYQRARVNVLRGWKVEDAVLTPADGRSKCKLYRVSGRQVTLKEIEAMCGIPVATLRSRLDAGWDADRAMSTPPDRGNTRRGKKFLRSKA